MAETPLPKVPDDPLRAQLGEEEWKRLTDERARQQQAVPPPVAPTESTGPVFGASPRARYHKSYEKGLPQPERGLQKFVQETLPPPVPRRGSWAAPAPNVPIPTPTVSGAKPQTSPAQTPEPTPGTTAPPTSPAPPQTRPRRAGAASKARRLGQEQLQDRLLDEARGATEIYDSALGDIRLELVHGKYMSNIHEARGKFEQRALQKLLDNDEVSIRALSEEQLTEYKHEASRMAARMLAKFHQSATGRWVVDPYDYDLTDKILKWGPLSPFRAMFSPTKFGGPGDIPIEEGGLGRRAQLMASPAGLRGEGPLSQFARASFFNVVESAFRSGDWGHRPHIETMRRGANYFDRIGDLALALDPVHGKGEVADWKAKAAAGGLMVGITLFDIDLVTLGLLPAGKLTKAAKIARISGRLSRAEKMLEISASLRAGEINTKKAYQMLRDISYRTDKSVGNAFSNLVTLNAAPKLGASASNFAHTADDLLKTGAAHRIQAQKLRASADALLAKAINSGDRVKAQKILLDAQAESAIADAFTLAAVEARKDRLLIAAGFSAEEAADITKVGQLTRGDKTIRTRVNSEVTRLEKELKDLEFVEGKEVRDAFREANEAYQMRLARSHVPGWVHEGTHRVFFREDLATRLVGEAPPVGATGTVGGKVVSIRVVDAKTGQTIPRGKRSGPAGARVRVTVLLENGEEVELKLASRLKGKEHNIARRDSRGLNDLAHEVYERRVDALLLNKRTAASAAKLKAAREISESLADGGPTHEALKLYVLARKKAAGSKKALEAVQKKAGKAMARANKNLVLAANKTIQAGRKKLSADTLEKTPEIIADAMDEVARGILAFRDRGLRSLGMEEGGTTLWAARKATRKAGKARIEAAFSSAAHEIPATEKARALSKAHIQILDKATGKSRINGKAIFQDLKESYGADVLKKFTKDNPRFLSYLRGGIKKGEEVADFQNALRQFTRYGEASKSLGTGADWGAQFISSWKSVSNFHPSYSRNKLWTRKGKIGEDGKKGKDKDVFLPIVPTTAGLTNWWNRRRMGTFGDPILSRLGNIGEKQAAIFKSTEHLMTRFSSEMLDIAHAKHLGKDTIERVVTYLDWNAAKKGGIMLTQNKKFLRETVEGKTRLSPKITSSPGIPSEWQAATGAGSPFIKAVRQIIGDTRVNPAKAEDLANEAQVVRLRMEKEFSRLLGTRSDELLEAGIGGEDLARILEELPDQLVSALPNLAKQSGEVGVSKALVGLSRMWIRSDSGTITSAQAAVLLAVAHRTLKKPGMSYKKFADQMERITRAVIGGTDNAAKSHAIAAANIGLAANLGAFNTLMVRSTMGSIDANTARNINRVFSGELEGVDDIAAALEGAAMLGLPLSESRALTLMAPAIKGLANKMSNATKELIQTGTVGHKAAFTPKNLIDEIEAAAGKITKELEATRGGKFSNAATGFDSATTEWINLWKASATTGLLIPNPRYYVNNIFGDFSQIWLEAGFWTGGTRTFSNLPTNLPFIGRRAQDWQLRMNAWAHKQGREALPGIMDTLFNPFLGQIFRGEAGVFTTKANQVVKYKDVRKWALEDGIISDFVAEDIIGLMAKMDDDHLYLRNKIGLSNKEWARHRELNAGIIQHRQRMGMYCELLRKGASREEAAKRTLRALYDWKHGITKLEAAYFAKMIPFYRFWRVSTRQIAESLLTPFTQPSGKLLKDAMLGNTRMARLRQQLFIWPNLPDIVFQDNVNAGIERHDLLSRLAPLTHPRYLSTRATTGTRPYDLSAREFYEMEEGKRYTHSTWTLPQITALDSSELTFAGIFGMVLFGNKVGELLGIDVPGVDTQFAEDAEARFFEPMLGTMNPFMEHGSRLFLTSAGADLDYEIRSNMRTLNNLDLLILTKTPGLSQFFKNSIEYDEETGKYSMPLGNYLAYQALPIASTQVGSWLRGFQKRATDPRVGGGFGKQIREITGFGREVPIDVPKQIEMALKTRERLIREHGDKELPPPVPGEAFRHRRNK